MKLFSSSFLNTGGHSLAHSFFRAFPTPRLMAPIISGVDISDASVKWLALSPWKDRFRVAEYGTAEIAPGLVDSGTIKNETSLSEALKIIKQHSKFWAHAHAALPEEAGYVFSMKVPSSADRAQVLNMIEFQLEDRVPLPPSQAVYDYDLVSVDESAQEAEVAVTVFPKDIAESYVRVFANAGVELVSLELEARSIARAITMPHRRGTADDVFLLTDFGRTRTGFSVIKNGIPIFTSTVALGGDLITKSLVERAGIAPEDCERFKNEHGIFGKEQKVVDAITGIASSLADEISRICHYWDTKRDERGARIAEISRVVLAGGSSNLSGLPEYVAGRVQIEVVRADMWGRVCRFDDYIPPIERRPSFGYATAIGLALRSS